MARDISIAISAKDNFTQAITTMRNANSSFNKDLTGLSQKLDALNKNKITLKLDTDRAKSALKDAEKQFLSTGNAADKMKMEFASANYDKANRNLNLVSKNARQTEKDILNMTDAVSKADNRAGGIGKKSGISGTFSTLAKAGFTKMAGDTVSQIANTAIGSAFGSDTGTMFGSTLSGIATGAAMGSIIPGVGTAIGGAVGAGIGAINGATKNFEKEDDAFKSVVQDSYTGIKQSRTNRLSKGSTIAENRESDLQGFTTLLQGNKEAASEFQKKLIEIGRTPPFSYELASDLSKNMIGSGLSTEDIESRINSLANASSALGLSDSNTSTIASLLDTASMMGTVDTRVLKTLSKNGIDAYQAIADSFSLKKSDVEKGIRKLDADDVISAIYKYMENDPKFKGGADRATNTYVGAKGIKESHEEDLDAAMGIGHDKERKEGIQNEIEWFNSKSGSALKEAYEMQGKFKASLENLQKELEMKAQTSVVSGEIEGKFSEENKARLKQLADDYKISKSEAAKGDKEAGMQAARDIEEAKIIAANEYKASDGYQLQLEAEKSLIANIREDTGLKKEYWDTGHSMRQELSKGFASDLGMREAVSPNGKKYTYYETASSKGIGLGGYRGEAPPINQYPGRSSSNATGLFRVPYNNYPALLHEGETVNTAVEARSMRNSPTVTITGNNFTVREEADIDKIARALAEKIKRQSLIS